MGRGVWGIKILSRARGVWQYLWNQEEGGAYQIDTSDDASITDVREAGVRQNGRGCELSWEKPSKSVNKIRPETQYAIAGEVVLVNWG